MPGHLLSPNSIAYARPFTVQAEMKKRRRRSGFQVKCKESKEKA